MRLRVTTFLILCAFWVPSVALVLAQDAPDYKPLVGVWTWRPNREWSAVRTIQSVSDTGLVTAEWKDPHWGTIPFKTQAQTVNGNTRIKFGGSTKYDLEYDKKKDVLIGPVTNLPPKYTEPEWQTAHFTRTK